MALIKLLKHFCDVNGMEDQYQSGIIPAESFLHKCSGVAIIGIQDEKPDGKGGMYKSKNIVKDYILEPKGSMMKPLPEMKDTFSDEIPF